MSGETELDKLLSLMQPRLIEGEYVFCSLSDCKYGDLAELEPLASYQETEGLSLLLSRLKADDAGLRYDSVFRGISLSIHSNLNAVGLTAVVGNKLASHGIPANIIAAHYHDHIFVPTKRAELALQLLSEFAA